MRSGPRPAVAGSPGRPAGPPHPGPRAGGPRGPARAGRRRAPAGSRGTAGPRASRAARRPAGAPRPRASPPLPETGAAGPSASRATTASGRPFGVARVEARSSASSARERLSVRLEARGGGTERGGGTVRRSTVTPGAGRPAVTACSSWARLARTDCAARRASSSMPGDRGGARRLRLAHERAIGQSHATTARATASPGTRAGRRRIGTPHATPGSPRGLSAACQRRSPTAPRP